MSRPCRAKPRRLAAVCVLGLLAARPCLAPAQTTDETAPARNAVYAELLGNGLMYSVNYERQIAPQVWARFGGEAIGIHGAGFPLMINYVFGRDRHHLEVGAGALVGIGFNEGASRRETEAGALPTATVGYRYQLPSRGWVFRVGFTPFRWPEHGGELVGWFGLSAGRRF